MVVPTLTAEQQRIKDSYFRCTREFYTLVEMREYMARHHNVTVGSVNSMFRDMLKAVNAEDYLRISFQRALERKRSEEERLAREAERERLASGGASSSSSEGRRKN